MGEGYVQRPFGFSRIPMFAGSNLTEQLLDELLAPIGIENFQKHVARERKGVSA